MLFKYLFKSVLQLALTLFCDVTPQLSSSSLTGLRVIFQSRQRQRHYTHKNTCFLIVTVSIICLNFMQLLGCTNL